MSSQDSLLMFIIEFKGTIQELALADLPSDPAFHSRNSFPILGPQFGTIPIRIKLALDNNRLSDNPRVQSSVVPRFQQRRFQG